jgi:hypothetical protein
MAANDSHSTGIEGWVDRHNVEHICYLCRGYRSRPHYKWGTKAVGRPKINQRAQRAVLCTIAEKAGGDPRRHWMKRNVDLGLGLG